MAAYKDAISISCEKCVYLYIFEEIAINYVLSII